MNKKYLFVGFGILLGIFLLLSIGNINYSLRNQTTGRVVEDNILISRLKLNNGTYQKLNVQMIFDESGYCPYCFDGQKNYNEDEIDCQYSGINCPRCSLESPFVKLSENYSFMLIILLALTLLCFLFIIWYLLIFIKHRKRMKRIIKMSHLY